MDTKLLDLLRRTRLLASFTEPELRKLAKVLKERSLKRNQKLFQQGDVADSLYIVVSGRLRVSAADRAGHEKVLAFLGAGEVVGEMGLLSDKPRSATVIASTESELLQLRKVDFDALVASNLDVMRDLARAVVRRREATEQRTVEEASTAGGYQNGLVTVLLSPRGGAGTTTLATNLAVALAQRSPERVVLIDLNVLFGHVPVLLNVTPRTALATMSAVSLRQMDRENLEFYVTRHAESSLRVWSSTLRPEQSELVTADHVKAAMEVARKEFVHVIVDLGRGFSEVNLTAIESTHNVLVVCTPDQSCLRDLTESQRIFHELHLPGEPRQYLMNHPSPYVRVSAEQFEQQLSVRMIASIPFGGDAPARAALEGQPLVARFSNSPTSKAIVSLAELLDQQLAEARALTPRAFLTVS